MKKKEKKKEHIHQYYKTQFNVSKTIIYRCTVPGCPHFLYEPMILGRFCACYRCGKTFVVTQKSTRSKKLHCEDCIRGRFNKRIEKSIVNIQSEKLLDEFIGQINEAIDSDRDIAIAAEMPNTNMTIDQILKERDKEGDTE